ncbi:hypothetical protein MSG34_19450 [Vibrio sp. 1CM2L]|uniref:hypothetical protein n=1 Tax=Vibrio sp. 1CM2L TaxID=2929166 RepID=UPI0020C00200|nr:hypothetical protein [Vibrio sp. 1CM2L]MCK8078339.1 hypothetical protein [Vibrio sp. 1CM2L]
MSKHKPWGDTKVGLIRRLNSGQTLPQAIKALGLTPTNLYYWRKDIDIIRAEVNLQSRLLEGAQQ